MRFETIYANGWGAGTYIARIESQFKAFEFRPVRKARR